MKKFLTLFFIPIKLFSQDITGIWTGYISTSEKHLPYELVISENNGKLTGYSHTTFDVNGKEITSVKTLKITNENGEISTVDEDLIYNDFKVNPPKKVRQFNVLSLKTDGKVMTLSGTFTTSKIKEFKPASGEVLLQKQDTSTKTKIIPKLDEMNLLGALSFLQPKKEIPVVTAIVEPPSFPKETGIIVSASPDKIIAASPAKPLSKQIVIDSNALPKPVAAKIIDTPTKKNPVVVAPPKVLPKPVVVKKAPPVIPPKQVAAVIKPVEKKVQPIIKPQPKPIVINTPAPVVPKPKQTIAVAPDKDLSGRKIETIQGLYFKSDSLTLTLYDNGEVDGDTVSIIMNGKVIISKQGLSTNAFTKTIYITPDLGDSLQLIMYAENLGSIPPNTGLLILMDGDIRHEIRFSGDLTKNAAITLKRIPK